MRIQAIDGLRGFAILGILVMNIGFHVNVLTGYVSLEPALLSDKVILVLQGIFADGRFRSLFCLIFGVGLAILYDHSQKKGLNATLYLKSRLFWLFIIGLIHAVFLFGGDILMLYALSAYVLLKHIPKDPDELLKLGKTRFIIGSVLSITMGALAIIFTPQDEIITRSSEAFLSKYGFLTANYLYYMTANAGIALMLLLLSFISIFWQVLGLMMIGIYLYRSDFFTKGLSPSAFRKTCVITVITSALSLTPYLLLEKVDATVTPTLATVPAFFMALLYAHMFVKLSANNAWLMTTLQNCGKIALSLYILQSFVMAILFKFVLSALNPDFIASINLLHLMLIVAVFTLVQMVLANWIVNRYKQGPLEKFWRSRYLTRYEKKMSEKAAL